MNNEKIELTKEQFDSLLENQSNKNNSESSTSLGILLSIMLIAIVILGLYCCYLSSEITEMKNTINELNKIIELFY